MASIVVQIILGIVFANWFEWAAHKYVMHDLGRRWRWLSWHWMQHHRNSALNKFHDKDYLKSPFDWNSRAKEILGLALLALCVSPVSLLAPVMYATMVTWTVLYYVTHAKSHRNPEWAKKYVPWHYEHHMGQAPDANFCVVMPLWDIILGTRVYHETDQHGRLVKFGRSMRK
mgnify:CR=1 FL=1|tara:strand:+ start:215796 stop:216311 length:516 start_codon:yes stop_codon:yes gene_type:complete